MKPKQGSWGRSDVAAAWHLEAVRLRICPPPHRKTAICIVKKKQFEYLQQAVLQKTSTNS